MDAFFRKAEFVNPRLLLMFSQPKTGKTELLTKLGKVGSYVIMDFDPNGGAGFYEGSILPCFDMTHYLESLTKLKEHVIANGKLKFLAIDTITFALQVAINALAVQRYNTQEEKDENINTFDITSLGYGKGHDILRKVTNDFVTSFLKYADHVIVTAHVADKFISSTADEPNAIKVVDLPGKMKNTFGAAIDAIGLLKRDEDNKNFIDFAHSKEDAAGTRTKHLRNQKFLLSELDPVTGELITYWDKIYLD